MKPYCVRFEHLILLAFLLVSCSKKEEYTLSVSTEFTEKQIDLIISAVEVWEKSCGIYVQVYVEKTSIYSTDVIYPIQGTEHLGFHTPFIDKIEIFIDKAGKNDPFFYNTVLHELGHWLGGLHTSNIEDVMFPTTDDEDGFKILTQNDLDSVCPWR